MIEYLKTYNQQIKVPASFPKYMFLLDRLGLISIFLTIPYFFLSPPGMVSAQSAPNLGKQLLEKAEKLEHDDEYAESERIYRQILSSPQNNYLGNDNIRMRLGKILQVQGKFDAAIKFFRRVTTSSDFDMQAEAFHALGDLITLRENSARSVAQGLSEIRQNPDKEVGYCHLAAGLAVQGQLINGLNFLESESLLSLESGRKLAKSADCSGVAGYTSGSGYRTSRSIRQDGILLFRQLISRYPQDQLARTELLEILDSYGKPTEAIAAYRAEILRQPNNDQLYWLLASKLSSNNQNELAIDVYENMIAKGKSYPELYPTLGNMVLAKQPDRAIQYYLRGIQAFPTYGPSNPRNHVIRHTSYGELVEVLARQNRLDQLLPILEKFMPNPTIAVYGNLAQALCYQNHLGAMKIVNQRLQQRYPNVMWEIDRCGNK
jgi:tetratricopeptide (TPR) repeat protein